MIDEKPLIEMKGVSKRFGRIQAVRSVDFAVPHKTIVGLLGDNGAGKSTLVNLLLGAYPIDEGAIYFEGEKVQFSSPREARDNGIEPVYQGFGLIDTMSIDRNFFLGREPTRNGLFSKFLLDRKRMRQISQQSLEATIRIKLRASDDPISLLSGGERQSIAIGRAIHFGMKLLILDEPTSALSVREVDRVLECIQEATKRGLSVIFITHNVYHVYAVADKFTILDEGIKIAEFDKKDVNPEEISRVISTGRIP